MSRNKLVLLIFLLAIVYIVLPDDGTYGIIKANFRAILPYIMIGIIIYLVITINILKRAWKKLDSDINDANVINFAKIMNITFDVKRMLGPGNLIDLYSKVNFSAKASMKAKQLLYEAMRRKRLDVPPPGKGTDIEKILNKPHRTEAEVKAARIEAAAKAKRKKKK
ncbi:MAG: hypothetical protein ACLSAO_01515 [Anaerovoracaceae bacterium]